MFCLKHVKHRIIGLRFRLQVGNDSSKALEHSETQAIDTSARALYSGAENVTQVSVV
jgi:hypothetical protein